MFNFLDPSSWCETMISPGSSCALLAVKTAKGTSAASSWCACAPLMATFADGNAFTCLWSVVPLWRPKSLGALLHILSCYLHTMESMVHKHQKSVLYSTPEFDTAVLAMLQSFMCIFSPTIKRFYSPAEIWLCSNGYAAEALHGFSDPPYKGSKNMQIFTLWYWVYRRVLQTFSVPSLTPAGSGKKC